MLCQIMLFDNFVNEFWNESKVKNYVILKLYFVQILFYQKVIDTQFACHSSAAYSTES